MHATLDHAPAALAAARSAGLVVDRAEVVSVAANVLVRARPWPRGGPPDGRDRGLPRLGGPYEAGGRVVTLWTPAGPLWSDWEDAHLGPLEWDLACLVASGRVRGDDFGCGEAALAAHGGTYDEMLLEACVGARVAQGAAYLAATGRGDVGGHLAWLRSRAS